MPRPTSYLGSRVGNSQVCDTTGYHCRNDVGLILICVDRSRRRGRIRRCGGNVGEYRERRRYDRPGRDGGFTSGKPIQPSADSDPARAIILTPDPGIQRCRIAWIRYPCRGLRWATTKPNGWASDFATTTAISQKLRTSTSISDLWHLGSFAVVAAMGTQHAPPVGVYFAPSVMMRRST